MTLYQCWCGKAHDSSVLCPDEAVTISTSEISLVREAAIIRLAGRYAPSDGTRSLYQFDRDDVETMLRVAFEAGQSCEREACAVAAENAKLPEHYQWGHDAMEQFDFGKECAAEAIRARAALDRAGKSE